MEVWITYCKDGYGGQEVDKVFGDRYVAIRFVVKNVFSRNGYYASKTQEELEALALDYLDCHSVIGV